MTKTGQQPEALVFASDRPTNIGDDLYQWSVDAEALIRAQQARIAELEASESRTIVQRDHCEEVIDRMADAVLGKDRHEWTSNYDYMDAAQEVEDRMAELESQLEAIGAGGVEPPRKTAAAPQAVRRWPEKLGETCMDGGTCHHDCKDKCFRRECCAPLTLALNSGLTMEQWRYPEAAPQAVQGATQPAAQGMEAKDAARYRFLRDGDWRENDDVAPFIHLQLNALWDEKIDAALAAQPKQGDQP